MKRFQRLAIDLSRRFLMRTRYKQLHEMFQPSLNIYTRNQNSGVWGSAKIGHRSCDSVSIKPQRISIRIVWVLKRCQQLAIDLPRRFQWEFAIEIGMRCFNVLWRSHQDFETRVFGGRQKFAIDLAVWFQSNLNVFRQNYLTVERISEIGDRSVKEIPMRFENKNGHDMLQPSFNISPTHKNFGFWGSAKIGDRSCCG